MKNKIFKKRKWLKKGEKTYELVRSSDTYGCYDHTQETSTDEKRYVNELNYSSGRGFYSEKNETQKG